MCVLDSVIIVVGYILCSIAKCAIIRYPPHSCYPHPARTLICYPLLSLNRLFSTLTPVSSPALQRLVFITVITISEVSLLVLIQLSDLKYKGLINDN